MGAEEWRQNWRWWLAGYLNPLLDIWCWYLLTGESLRNLQSLYSEWGLLPACPSDCLPACLRHHTMSRGTMYTRIGGNAVGLLWGGVRRPVSSTGTLTSSHANWWLLTPSLSTVSSPSLHYAPVYSGSDTRPRTSFLPWHFLLEGLKLFTPKAKELQYLALIHLIVKGSREYWELSVRKTV